MFEILLGIVGVGMLVTAGASKVSDVSHSVKSEGVKKTVIKEAEKAKDAVVEKIEKIQEENERNSRRKEV